MSNVPSLSKPWSASGEATPEQVTAASRSNFSLSFFFLPKNQRRGITHFYALSRVIDDSVDEAPDAGLARQQLEAWKQEVARCYDATPSHPVAVAMQQTIREFGIPRRWLELLLEGCEMDLEKKRYRDFAELYEYCYRVAGVIGLISMKIFGLDGEAAQQAAVELGLALQLTNILRDVKVDAALGRLYIPQEDIQRYRLSESNLLDGNWSPKLKLLLKHHADRAQFYFDSAFTQMKRLPRRPLIAAWIMGKVYQRLLERIRRRDYQVFSAPIAVPKLEKLWIAASQEVLAIFNK